MSRVIVYALLGGMASSVAAAPDISVGSMYEYMDASKGALLKRVRNSGSSTAFVKVSISEILFDESDTPVEKDLLPISFKAGEKADGLVASPARLIVPAGGLQASRFVYMGAADVERYFRVRFVPVLPEKKDDFGLSDEQAIEYKKDLSVGVNVMTGYGTVFIVHPKEPMYQTELLDLSGTYVVKNNGNSTIIVDAFYGCKQENRDCSAPQKIHVRPNVSKEFVKEAGFSYRFQLIEGGQKKAVDFGV